MVVEVGVDVEGNVGAGADLQNRAEIAETRNEFRILYGAHPVAETRGAHEVECIDDAERATDLACMDRQSETCVPGDVEGTGIVGDAAHALLACHVETCHQRILAARGVFGCGDDAVRTKVTLAGHNDAGLDTRLLVRPADTFADAGEIGVGAKSDPVAMVGGNDDLAVDRVRPGQLSEVALRQQRIIRIRAEKSRDSVIADEKLGEVVPDIRAIAEEVGRVDAVFVRLARGKNRRCCPFDMAVDLGLQKMSGQRKLHPCEPAGMPRCAATDSPISA